MKLKDYFFCDDVRFEKSNKISLMGLYGDLINLQVKDESKIAFPIPIRVAILMRFEFDESEERPDRFTLALTMNGKSVANLEGQMDAKANRKLGNIAVNMEGFPLELGDIGFEVELLKDGKSVFSKKIKSAIHSAMNS